MEGFLQTLPERRSAPTRLPRCGSCGLKDSCLSPKMPVSGKGKRKILIVGEAPGVSEDARGEQFVGKAGQYLRKVCAEVGIDLREDCWLTNAIICWPGKGNPTPTDKQILWCRPNLLNTIAALEPHAVVLVGGSAVKSLIGHLWREDVGAVSRWVGWKIPLQRFNAWVCPSYHPSYCMREEDENNQIPRKFLVRHLREVSLAQGRPWDKVPAFAEGVRVVLDPVPAASILRQMSRNGVPVAVDYETDRLKPDAPDARIVSFAASDGETTISCPWHGEVIEAAHELLQSGVPKIGANVKFEIRWSMKEFRNPPRNWLWDTMLAAHALDTRPGICGLKFQAFTQLGQEPWDDDVKPYLEGAGGNGKNRIHEADLGRLLKYGGLDALLEWKLARIQMKQMGVKS